MKIGSRNIGTGHPVFVVAEIGQNHQGSLEIAKEMIVKAKEIGVDCVKFQKSCLEAKFTKQALDRSYSGKNSWGRTYGEHKEHLEFTIEEYETLQQFCSEVGILFSASAMDPISLQQLKQLQLPFIKIGSGDADNIPLITEAAALNVPLIVSTGMQSWNQVERVYSILRNQSMALLHCVSAYPTPPSDAVLKMIPLYREHFPDVVIGYSGHELGLQLSVASVLLGACIIERHFTLDKNWKGTDHKASLDPTEFSKLIEYIRSVENLCVQPNMEDILSVLSKVLKDNEINPDDLKEALKPVTIADRKLLLSEIPCFQKLGKSLVYKNDFTRGHVLTRNDINVKVSEPHGIRPEFLASVLGQRVVRSCFRDEPIMESDLMKDDTKNN
ncbi:sialic acid synthase [Wyeomyia smithii]|uniref:sialic acid synthase n=1 Tax=Wyeomyia smithii TaxID=174621 RepID=UPI002467F1DC|nr:sialic acid synthase [Wyeomyia smithii]